MQAYAEAQDYAAAARYRDERASLLSVLPPSEQELQATLSQLRSNLPEARHAAARALGARGDPAAAPLVVSALHDVDERVYAAAEEACWALWLKSGDESVDALMATGMRTMEALKTPAGGVAALEAALVAFSSAAALMPEFAEAWNKRATVLYMLDKHDQSLQDCERVVALNPDHFGALSGGAMCALKLGDLALAIRWFKMALAVNPRLETARKVSQLACLAWLCLVWVQHLMRPRLFAPSLSFAVCGYVLRGGGGGREGGEAGGAGPAQGRVTPPACASLSASAQACAAWRPNERTCESTFVTYYQGRDLRRGGGGPTAAASACQRGRAASS